MVTELPGGVAQNKFDRALRKRQLAAGLGVSSPQGVRLSGKIAI
jgi:hypothetical protein